MTESQSTEVRTSVRKRHLCQFGWRLVKAEIANRYFQVLYDERREIETSVSEISNCEKKLEILSTDPTRRLVID
jgi:hypothetical protein